MYLESFGSCPDWDGGIMRTELPRRILRAGGEPVKSLMQHQ